MKNYNTRSLSTALHILKKVFFWGQITIISFAVPSLYCVGISYNNNKPGEKRLWLNNKGKKILASEKAGNTTNMKYFPAV